MRRGRRDGHRVLSPKHIAIRIWGRAYRVLGLVERDPQLKVDRLTSAILEFPSGQSTFTCSMQLVPYQRSQFFGTKGRIESKFPSTLR